MPVSSSGITGSAFPEWRFPSYRNRRFPWPDRRCKTVRNTHSGQNPLFEEGDIFRTIIPLKKIATQKVGGDNVPRNVPQDVSRMSLEEIENIIKGMIKEDNRVSRKDIAMILGVSEKTITRCIKEIPNIKYVGKGKNGHWEWTELQ